MKKWCGMQILCNFAVQTRTTRGYNLKNAENMEILAMWHLWLIAAIVLVIVELFTNIIASFCLAIGCVAACIGAACDVSLSMQLLLLAIGSVVAFMLIPPLVKKHRLNQSKGQEDVTNMGALIGRTALVLEDIDGDKKGRVKVDGDNWQAVCQNGVRFAAGEKVRIVSYDSIVLTVEAENKETLN